MIGLQQSFPQNSVDQWKERLKKDLKSDNLDALHFHDEIEDLQFDAYNSAEDLPKISSEERGYPRLNNHWRNTFFINVKDEATANKKALQVLMQGVDALVFKIKEGVNLDLLLANIQLEYIHTIFMVDNPSQIEKVSQLAKANNESISIALDVFSTGDQNWSVSDLSTSLKKQQVKTFLVDGYSIQQTGANCTQELAFMLSAGNHYLHELVDNGLTIDEAAACLHFRIGLGNNYFQQIAKIRAFKSLWSTIIRAYQPQHGCTYNTSIWAQTGLLNKSAKDPYTNLLRQTTEAMSALNAGIDFITVLPYDAASTFEATGLAERMAINIPLILEEESYLDKVIDPLGGSYAIEQLTAQLIEKSWALFQELEALGGLANESAKSSLSTKITTTAQLRIETYKTKKNTLIGVNKFPNIDEVKHSISQTDNYFGLNFINLENELNK